MKDLMERKEIGEALEGEKKYRHLAKLMPIGVYSINELGLITFYNDRAAEIWGRRPRLNDITEQPFCGSLKIFTPDGKPMPHDESYTARALKEQRSFRNEELYIEGADGHLIELIVSSDPVFNEDGLLTGAISVFHDITQRKRAEDDLRRLAGIVESSQDAIYSRTLDGVVTSWNLGAERIFGFEKTEILGKSISLFTPESYQEEELNIIGKICRGEKVEPVETIRKNHFGRHLYLSLTMSPIHDNKGRVIGITTVARDNSDQVQIRNELQLYNERLKQLDNHNNRFIGLASHELKTPLTVIKGHLEWLALESQNGMNKSSVTKALIHIDRLSDLVSSLLDVSKVDGGALQLNLASFNISDLLNESIETVMATEKTHQIMLENCLDCIVVADRQRIEQAVTNLLLNAIKYSPDADKVLVRCKTEGDDVVVSVQDFGIGIPADQLDKVFSRFYRVEGLAPSFSGLGIGLYITSEIIKRHHGDIWVESEIGKGSVFSFKIPCK